MTKQQINTIAEAKAMAAAGILLSCGVRLNDKQHKLLILQGSLLFLNGIEFGIMEANAAYAPSIQHKGGEQIAQS